MGQIEEVVRLTREIESLLDQLGASGRGMHEKISSVENKFDKETIKKMRWVATLRNKTMHEHGFKIDSMSEFKAVASDLIKQLKKMNKSKKKEGCYIATAVYGSYDCPEVLVLRNFRDDRLLPNPLGRLFVRLYYATSPALAKRIKPDGRIAKMTRTLLNGMVRRIKK
ncbi:MAG TPA: hypothetical protein PK466_10005 [Thermotogota bacterium]|nr:hypothetical protein [Thermotogota bacterium]HPJ88604.1 hypothetical protein [Thermotogota bacterium]HPR96656.1 hypothetical protein [Thermotogota bacterium]